MAILSHKSLETHHVQYTDRKLEYTCVIYSDHNIGVASVYRPPSYKMECFLPQTKDLVMDIKADMKPGQSIVIMAEFNEDPTAAG